MYKLYEQLLDKTGESTYKVAMVTGIGQQAIASWKKRAEKDPTASMSLENMKKLSDHFHVSLEYWVS